MTKCQLLSKFTSLLITTITQLTGFQLIQLLEALNEQQTARHGNVSRVFHSIVRIRCWSLSNCCPLLRTHCRAHCHCSGWGDISYFCSLTQQNCFSRRWQLWKLSRSRSFLTARLLLYPTKHRVAGNLLVLVLIKASLFCLQATTAPQTKSWGLHTGHKSCCSPVCMARLGAQSWLLMSPVSS